MGIITRLRNAFFNTTGETGQQLKDNEAKALAQEHLILAIYESVPGVALGPWSIYRLTDRKWPITSVRRAITRLTDRGYLIKTDSKGRTPYGRREHLWAFNPSRGEQS